MKKLFFVLAIIALCSVAAVSPVNHKAVVNANVTDVSYFNYILYISGTYPNSLTWGQPYIESQVYNKVNHKIFFRVKIDGEDCPVCGISNPAFLPFTLTFPIGDFVDYTGWKVFINGVYWLTIQ